MSDDKPAGTPLGATRNTSKTGGAKDLKIYRYDQISPIALKELAARYGVGSLKYPQANGLDNWKNGYPWSWSYRAMAGHMNDFWAGETFDPDTYLGTDHPEHLDEAGNPRPGTNHLAAVMWHAAAMIEWLETHPELDDRPSTVLARSAAGLAGTEDGENEDDGLELSGYDPTLPPGFLFVAPLATVGPLEKWADIGATTDVPPAFGSQLGDLEIKGNLNIDGIKIAAGLTGRPTVFETVDDDIMRRVYIPNPEFTAGDEPGKFTITPRPAPVETFPGPDGIELRRVSNWDDPPLVGQVYVFVGDEFRLGRIVGFRELDESAGDSDQGIRVYEVATGRGDRVRDIKLYDLFVEA